MLERYKRTLVPTQMLIGTVTIVILVWSHRFTAALAFFVAMQVGAAIGALWAHRLKSKIERAPMVR